MASDIPHLSTCSNQAMRNIYLRYFLLGICIIGLLIYPNSLIQDSTFPPHRANTWQSKKGQPTKDESPLAIENSQDIKQACSSMHILPKSIYGHSLNSPNPAITD